jgi:hypothetical protein
MAPDAPDDADPRGDPVGVALVFLGLTALGTLLLLSQEGQSLPEAVLSALLLAVPFAFYAWYTDWGG